MRKLLFLLILFPNSLIAQNFDLSLGEILKNKDSLVVCLAVTNSKKLQAVLPNRIFGKYQNKETHEFKVGYATIYEQLNKYYISCHDKKQVLTSIKSWLINDSLLNIIQFDTDIQLEEVFFETKHTKSLVTKYLTKNQSWESLTSWQSYELYLDFMNFTERMTKAERKNLYLSLKETIKKIKRKGAAFKPVTEIPYQAFLSGKMHASFEGQLKVIDLASCKVWKIDNKT